MNSNRPTLILVLLVLIIFTIGLIVYLNFFQSSKVEVQDSQELNNQIVQAPDSFTISETESQQSATENPPLSMRNEPVSNTRQNFSINNDWRDSVTISGGSLSYGDESDIEVMNSNQNNFADSPTIPSGTSASGNSNDLDYYKLIEMFENFSNEITSNYLDTFEEFTQQRNAIQTSQTLELPISLSGFQNCGDVPEINPNDFSSEVVRELSNNSTLNCLGKAFVNGCSSVSLSVGDETSYLSVLSDSSCYYGRSFTGSLIDETYPDTITFCPVALSNQNTALLEQLDVQVSSDTKELFTLVESLLEVESELKLALESTESTKSDIENIERDIESVKEKISNIGELSDQEYYSIAMIAAVSSGNCLIYSQ